MEQARHSVIIEVQNVRLEISTSRIQEIPLSKYLGWNMTEQTIKPQKIQLQTSVNTFQDLQQPLREINWVRPVLRITSDELAPLFDLLRGDHDIKSRRTQKALEKVIEAFQT